MEMQETTQDGTQAKVVESSEPQTEMQDIKTDVPDNEIDHAAANQAESTEVQPVGTEATEEQGEPYVGRI